METNGVHRLEIHRLSAARRGFLLGFPAGALLTAASSLHGDDGTLQPAARTAAAKEAQRETTAPHAMTKELAALLAENQGLKKQVLDGNTRRTPRPPSWPPCAQRPGLKKQVVEINAASHATTASWPPLLAENQSQEASAGREHCVASHDWNWTRSEGNQASRSKWWKSPLASQATTKELAALRTENRV